MTSRSLYRRERAPERENEKPGEREIVDTSLVRPLHRRLSSIRRRSPFLGRSVVLSHVGTFSPRPIRARAYAGRPTFVRPVVLKPRALTLALSSRNASRVAFRRVESRGKERKRKKKIFSIFAEYKTVKICALIIVTALNAPLRYRVMCASEGASILLYRHSIALCYVLATVLSYGQI